MRKTLAIGCESFADMIKDHRYYVDKTGFIKPLMESGSFVQVMVRPRRFGKTLFMDTVQSFLAVDPKNPGAASRQAQLFAGLDILKDGDFCSKFMGQFPVLFLSLKDVKGLNFTAAQKKLASTLWQVADSYSHLIESPRLSDSDKTFLKNCGTWEYLQDLSNFEAASVFLTRMVLILARHYERQVVLLIDEYDVPLQKAMKAGYYKDMLSFMQGFLSVLKPGPFLRVNGVHALLKAVLTGCLRVSKASIFTDVNNFDVNSVCIQGSSLSAAVGFTEEEVSELLDYFDLASQKPVVKRWYDGYRIGSAEIYCPWDVIRYCSDVQSPDINPQTFVPENYWADTSSNDVIEEFLGFLSSEDADRMQTLLDGGEIELKINDQLTYGEIQKHRSEDFWTLLLFTGYLTVSAILGGDRYRLRIPNAEIHETFNLRVKSYFSDGNDAFVRRGEAVAKAIFEGDPESVKERLSVLLENYVSIRDAATRAKAENYYHGFLLGLLSSTGMVKNIKSNREAGDGYADLLFTSAGARIGVVIEIKHCDEVRDMQLMSQKALEQIREKRYARGLDGYGCSRLLGYGVAFCRKACAVSTGELEPA